MAAVSQLVIRRLGARCRRSLHRQAVTQIRLSGYMDSPCVARASSLLDSGSDCGRYIRPLVASVEAGPDDDSLAGAPRHSRCPSHRTAFQVSPASV